MRSNKWTINEATEALVDHLPDRSGLYMFVWRIPFPFPTHTNLAEHHFRVIVYVGQAGGRHSGNTLQKRYRQEYARIVGTHPEVLWQNEGETRDDRIERVLNLRDLEYWYHDNISETDTLEFYENQLIALFGPKGNSKGNSSDGRLTARLGKAVPAF
jgi:hypothetical protein